MEENTRTAFVDNPKANEIKSWYQANFGVDLSMVSNNLEKNIKS